MEEQFLVEVDALGAVVSIESGDIARVPSALMAVGGKIVDSGAFGAKFIWHPDGRTGRCIVQVTRANPFVDRGATAYVQGEWVDNLPFGLTDRELDVLTLLVLGISSAHIAQKLFLATRTVTTHIDRVMRKLGAQSRTAAATIAMDEGLVRVPFPHLLDDSTELLRIGRILSDTQAPPAASTRVTRKPLVIGAAIPVTGSNAADGAEMVRASQLAIDEVNARGGVDGRRVALDVVDVDIMEPESVSRSVSALIERGVDVLTSGYLAHQERAHELVADSGITYLHAATLDVMARRVSEDPDRYGNIFQVCANDSNYAPRFVEMMSQLRDRRQWAPASRQLVVLQSGWTTTDLGLAAAASDAERDGWELVTIRLPDGDASRWAQIVQQVTAMEPAAVMIGNYLVDDTLAFLESFLSSPSRTLVYALYSPSVPEFRERIGARGDGILWATVTGTYSDPRARAFAKRYRARFGVNPGRSHAGIAYDRVHLITQAWAFAENPRDPRRVSQTLRDTVYRGVNGVYYFGDASQTTLTFPGRTADPSLGQAHLVFQIQQGKQRIIDPAPYADAAFTLPPWMTPVVERR
ncbi:hypothetical protein GCM10009847_09280 [Leucobacter tardus]|uniref:ABC transporter substrate-binding protein n=1 Tax=Leucobacter tardus TaxID=501483 RepID=A0A939TQM5_9MICO|nr:ABC transporter substrate-binding protein [Leucobacter tardus]MBO2989127.1 ABC transporter substrate-binding protein [Leucobacter tardus]